MAGAKAAAEQAEALLLAAREHAREADAGRAQAEGGLRDQQAALERLRAEADALAALALPKTAGSGVIDLVEVKDGYAEALAAALGDDLVGGLDPAAPVHWRDHTVPGDEPPALPAGCTPLSGYVVGPPALARRLAQIGVAEPSAASALQARLLQGQRLVSHDGGLWRWDGFVRLPDASGPGATRLRQRERLRQLESECAQQAAVLADLSEQLADDDRVDRARSALEEA
jgi:chromosome segregation protein